MIRIQKCFIAITLLALLAVPFLAEAQGILPSGQSSVSTCSDIKSELFNDVNSFKKIMNESKEKGLSKNEYLSFVLGCAVKTGKIRLFMMPYFVTYLIQFLLQIAGLIAVLFVVYGGFQYVKGGVSEDKDSGKKTLTHALVGLAVSVSAWIIVNFIQVALTS